ncbi:MAG: monovalent cation:proton antiporter-2 (CPA2) family protein [Pseudomonadota bacterium]
MDVLQESIIYLLAAIVMVPISRRLGFGSVLGYLVAGILIGPAGFGLIGEAEHVLHFAELGVVFLLFIIGLELQPSRLWVLRKMVFGLGAAQVMVTGVAIAAVAWAFGISPITAIVIGLILALSSTALVLQMLAESKQLNTTYGRAAFSTLLFQDLAVIPLIAIMPMLGSETGSELDLQRVLVMAATIIGLIAAGRYLLRPVLQAVANAQTPELFTGCALLVVLGAALAMQAVGMSMVLGAFIAGMMLADSEFRHQLEADIAPFKGLLLGLFFIAVGMTVNLGLLVAAPIKVLIIVVLLMGVKAAVLVGLARLFGVCDRGASWRFAGAMAQSGEFAFVLFAIAARNNVVPAELIDTLILAVAVSMLLTPFIYKATESFTNRMQSSDAREFDEVDDHHDEVIIAGFGRVGQIVARMLRADGRTFTALDIDTSQVDIVRRYGNVVHYADASRLDVLRSAGAEHAKVFVLTIANIEASVHTAESVMQHFPHLKIIARARNRRHAHKLLNIGVKHVYRETFLSSVAMTERALLELGDEADVVERIREEFVESDVQLLKEQQIFYDSEEQLIQSVKDAADELDALMQNSSPGEDAD